MFDFACFVLCCASSALYVHGETSVWCAARGREPWSQNILGVSLTVVVLRHPVSVEKSQRTMLRMKTQYAFGWYKGLECQPSFYWWDFFCHQKCSEHFGITATAHVTDAVKCGECLRHVSKADLTNSSTLLPIFKMLWTSNLTIWCIFITQEEKLR